MIKFKITGTRMFIIASLLLFFCHTATRAQTTTQTPIDDKAAKEAALREIQSLLRAYVSLAEQQKYDESLQTATRALALIEKNYGASNLVYTELVGNIGFINYLKKDYDAAERMYLRELDVYAANAENFTGDLRARAGERFARQNDKVKTLAYRFFYEGSRPRALALLNHLLADNEKFFGADDPNLTVALDGLAVLYNLQGRRDLALPLRLRVLQINEKAFGAESERVADVLSPLAGDYKERGDLIKAEQFYRRALAIIERRKIESFDAADAYNYLGDIYAERGDYERAAELKNRALKIAEALGAAKKVSYLTILINVASFYVDRGKYSVAQPLLTRALDLALKDYDEKNPNGSDIFVAKIATNLASIQMQAGDYKKAAEFYELSRQVQEKSYGAKSEKVASAINNIARAIEAAGDLEAAETNYGRALSIFEEAEGRSGFDVAIVLRNLALVAMLKKDYPKAFALLARSNDVQEQFLAHNLAGGSEKQKHQFLETFNADTDATISLHVNHAPQNAAAARVALTAVLQRKGRALDVMTDQIANLRRHAKPEDQKLLDQLAQAVSACATFEMEGVRRRDEKAQLDATIEKLQTQISERNAEIRAQMQSVTIPAVQKLIPPDYALVEIAAYQPYDITPNVSKHFGAPRYVAYILRSTGEPAFVELGEAAPIDELVLKLRAALSNPQAANVREIARALDERAMRPIRQRLGDTRRIFLSPDGELNLIPFAALVDENGKYLIENYAITYLTSGRDLLRLQTRSASSDTAFVLANPSFDMTKKVKPTNDAQRGLALGIDAQKETKYQAIDFANVFYPPLAGTATEAQQLAALMPSAKILTETAATEAALKNISRPRLLHIATHGFFLPNQRASITDDTRSIGIASDHSASSKQSENPLLRSGLILAGVNQKRSGANEDGVLTALEASALDLHGTKLVVLSACETGLGDVRNGAGVYGLRRAFVLAGSESQVMSLWQVNDAATRDLMTNYYKRLQAGEGRTEALRQVQIEMLADAKRAHPFYWAAFIQSGDWRKLN
jgi:CHAT domain-containing protein